MSAALHLLALSGSLRALSSNSILLRAARTLAPPEVEVRIYDGLGALPHFNPDLEELDLPAVRDFRDHLAAAQGVLIACPEYAHGVPGSFKNALDWVVGSGDLVGKPVALFNPSPRATYALASLTETLSVMMAEISAAGSLTLELSSNRLDEEFLTTDPASAEAIRNALARFAREIRERT